MDTLLELLREPTLEFLFALEAAELEDPFDDEAYPLDLLLALEFDLEAKLDPPLEDIPEFTLEPALEHDPDALLDLEELAPAAELEPKEALEPLLELLADVLDDLEADSDCLVLIAKRSRKQGETKLPIVLVVNLNVITGKC